MQFRTTDSCCSKLGKACCAGFWSGRRKKACGGTSQGLHCSSWFLSAFAFVSCAHEAKLWSQKPKRSHTACLGQMMWTVWFLWAVKERSFWIVHMFTMGKMWISSAALERTARMQKLVAEVCSYFLHWIPFEPYTKFCAHLLIYTNAV